MSVKRRDSARLIVVEPSGGVLLFRFSPPNRAAFWATPGGALDEGEDFASAARRELHEETGLQATIGHPIAVRINEFEAHWGEQILAEEHYFLIFAEDTAIDTSGHEEIEREIMKEHRWFTRAEVQTWHEPIFPSDLADMLQEFDAR